MEIMKLNTRIDTYQVKFGEHGVLQVESQYNLDEENTVVIRVKSDNEDGYYHNVTVMPGNLLRDLIDTLRIIENNLLESSKILDT